MIYKAVIFDLDGTLIDSMQLWREVDEEFLGKRGIAIPSDLFDNLPAGNSFIQTATYFKERFELPDTVESIMAEWTTSVTEHYRHSIPLKDGVPRLLKRIAAKGLRIGLGTSNSFELAKLVLSAHNIWESFEAVITGDMKLMGKPFPDIYLLCAQEMGVKPEDCLVIEDTLTGVQAGKAAGMTVWAIYDADSDPYREQILSASDAHFESYSELEKALFDLIP